MFTFRSTFLLALFLLPSWAFSQSVDSNSINAPSPAPAPRYRDVDLKPLALYSNDVNGPRQYTYGGAVEIGLQIVPHTHWRYQPYFEANGGSIMFAKNIPTPDTRRVNLCVDFGPGSYIPVGNDNRAMKMGLGFYHFSNDYTLKHNPGFDAFMLYVAYCFRNLRAPHFHKPSS